MAKFPSTEWAESYARALNENPRYAAAAAAWEGDILLLIDPDAAAPSGEGIHLDLFHGTCRSATYLAGPAAAPSEFEIRGRREDWVRLLEGRLDPIRAVMDRTFRLQGNVAKLLRFAAAAQELLRTASGVPRE